MATHIALWRAVNLGKTGKLAMAGLRDLLAELKLADVKTLLQSGNAVFSTRGASATLEKKLESACAARFGLKTEVFVRTAKEWTGIIEGNPFAKMAQRDPSHLVVMVLRGRPHADAIAELGKPGPEEVALGEGCLYITYPNGIGESKLNQNPAWKRLGAVGTARNWNTVSKIAAALA
ncbi:MAG: hypothetical protein K0S65_6209 [Labilithrix sp.]|nr:hypothetical protein [Labilithrix sp.]